MRIAGRDEGGTREVSRVRCGLLIWMGLAGCDVDCWTGRERLAGCDAGRGEGDIKRAGLAPPFLYTGHTHISCIVGVGLPLILVKYTFL